MARAGLQDLGEDPGRRPQAVMVNDVGLAWDRFELARAEYFAHIWSGGHPGGLRPLCGAFCPGQQLFADLCGAMAEYRMAERRASVK